jgi:hypothetical protein
VPVSETLGMPGKFRRLIHITQKLCVKLWELSRSKPGSEEYAEAQRLQGMLALADGACQAIGVSHSKPIPGIKADTHPDCGLEDAGACSQGS